MLCLLTLVTAFALPDLPLLLLLYPGLLCPPFSPFFLSFGKKPLVLGSRICWKNTAPPWWTHFSKMHDAICQAVCNALPLITQILLDRFANTVLIAQQGSGAGDVDFLPFSILP